MLLTCAALNLDTILTVYYHSEPLTFTNPCDSNTVTYNFTHMYIDPTSSNASFGAHITRNPPLVCSCSLPSLTCIRCLCRCTLR